jgi:hypothetical protein
VLRCGCKPRASSAPDRRPCMTDRVSDPPRAPVRHAGLAGALSAPHRLGDLPSLIWRRAAGRSSSCKASMRSRASRSRRLPTVPRDSAADRIPPPWAALLYGASRVRDRPMTVLTDRTVSRGLKWSTPVGGGGGWKKKSFGS